jgi:hypothetical protein
LKRCVSNGNEGIYLLTSFRIAIKLNLFASFNHVLHRGDVVVIGWEIGCNSFQVGGAATDAADA